MQDTTKQNKLSGYFTKEEQRKILSNTLRDTDKETYFLIKLLLETGCLVSETLSLKVEDFNTNLNDIQVKTLRRESLIREIPISPQFVIELNNWIAEKKLNNEDTIFQFSRKTAYKRVKKACQMAGLDTNNRCHPSTLRNTFAVNCLLQQVDIITLNRWMGHKNIKATIMYRQILYFPQGMVFKNE